MRRRARASARTTDGRRDARHAGARVRTANILPSSRDAEGTKVAHRDGSLPRSATPLENACPQRSSSFSPCAPRSSPSPRATPCPRPIDEAPGTGGGASGCTTCHGDASRAETNPLLQAAPPWPCAAAGAHAAHLHAGVAGRAVACVECHVVPTDTAHVNGMRDVAFGAAWSQGGVTGAAQRRGRHVHHLLPRRVARRRPRVEPGLDVGRAARLRRLPRRSAPEPRDPTAHMLELPPGTVDATGAILAANGLHMNGTSTSERPRSGLVRPGAHGHAANGSSRAAGRVMAPTSPAAPGPSCNSCHGGTAWQTNCTFCHGTPGGLAPAARGHAGQTARSQVSVGAHAKHLSLTLTTASAVTCDTCHPARSNVVTDTAHMNGRPAEVVFTGVAAQGTASTFTRTSDTAATCATYCHGRFSGGATSAAPSWVSTAARPAPLATGNAPSTGKHALHVSFYACSVCHGEGYSSTVASTGTAVAAPPERNEDHRDGPSGPASGHGTARRARALVPRQRDLVAARRPKARACDPRRPAAEAKRAGFRGLLRLPVPEWSRVRIGPDLIQVKER